MPPAPPAAGSPPGVEPPAPAIALVPADPPAEPPTPPLAPPAPPVVIVAVPALPPVLAARPPAAALVPEEPPAPRPFEPDVAAPPAPVPCLSSVRVEHASMQNPLTKTIKLRGWATVRKLGMRAAPKREHPTRAAATAGSGDQRILPLSTEWVNP